MHWRAIWRRAVLATPAHGEDASSLRLLGVAIGPRAREAVLAEPNEGNRTITLRNGGSAGDFTLRVVDSETVELSSPSGVRTLVLEEHAGLGDQEVSPTTAPSPPASIEDVTKKSGETIGLLAIERDARAPVVCPACERTLN